MDYFVSLDNTPYYQWQAELLIESFKERGEEENLVVGLALASASPRPEFCRNLYSHRRTHSFPDMGRVRGYDRMNRLYAMANILRSGSLSQPFCSVEPDCVLHDPVRIENKDVPHVVFQVNPFFTLDHVRENIPNLDQYLPKGKNWVTLGGTMYFNNLPQSLFDRVIFLAEMLAYEQAKAGKEIWRHTDKVAWAINIMGMVGQAVVEGVYTLDMGLADHQLDHNFVNYERGAPPHFSKSMFSYKPPVMLSFGDPIVAIADLPDRMGTTSARYISDLAKKCLQSRQDAR